MSDETTNQGQAAAGSERVGFCQDCGRPLTRETVRTVGSGVFCESCLEARIAGSAQTAGAAQSPGVPPQRAGLFLRLRYRLANRVPYWQAFLA